MRGSSAWSSARTDPKTGAAGSVVDLFANAAAQPPHRRSSAACSPTRAARCCATSSPSGASSTGSAGAPTAAEPIRDDAAPADPAGESIEIDAEPDERMPRRRRRRCTLFSPAGVVRAGAPLRLRRRAPGALGFDVEVDAGALARHQRFAGDDDTRLAAIHRVADARAVVAMASAAATA